MFVIETVSSSEQITEYMLKALLKISDGFSTKLNGVSYKKSLEKFGKFNNYLVSCSEHGTRNREQRFFRKVWTG